ncbi:hypothetical protein [Wukongibacter sp. M2B1]|uniref:hypothetical protein n=1 Tax=Wukongibacter sp. M2B1 TaxID=3088895 RepID=UPI003D7B20CA
MARIIYLLKLLMMAAVLMGCSVTDATEAVNQESLKLDTKFMGTYEKVDAFPYTTIEIICYEDGAGKYIRTVYQNGYNEIMEGKFIKVEEAKVKDEDNKVQISFLDASLTFIQDGNQLSYRKISPIVQDDFKLSNGLRKDMSYIELEENFELSEPLEPLQGPLNMTSVDIDGINVSLHSNTPSVEESTVFGYRIRDGKVKTFRGIGIGSSVEDVFALYEPRPLSEFTTSIEYKVGQYSLIFIIADEKVREIHCMNKM